MDDLNSIEDSKKRERERWDSIQCSYSPGREQRHCPECRGRPMSPTLIKQENVAQIKVSE